MFPPHKEFAVAECLSWVQHMSYGLVNLGVSYDHSIAKLIDVPIYLDTKIFGNR
jgi:hypothetical protein